DANFFLRQSDVPGHEREHGADGVRRLRGHPHRQFSVGLVEMRHASARLDRGNVDARQVDVLFDLDLGLREDLVRSLAVARFPMKNVVVLFVLLSVRNTGAPFSRALNGSTTTGSGSYSTSTA